MMKKYLLSVALLFVISITANVYGQKYKDVFPLISAASDDDAMLMLKEYLRTDLEHPNSNLLIALIYEKRYRNADVLTEYEKAVANAERAKLRFTKARVLVNEKEVSRNDEYYGVFANGFDSKGRPIVDYTMVSSAIIKKYDSVMLFLEKAPSIYNTFVKGVNTYDAAIKEFYKITSRYNSLDDLYLLYDESLKNELAHLKQLYDSTIFYLDEYKVKIAEYPIDGYNQTYTVNDIETYRLSGLITQSDFLINNIQLWNYGKWVDDINAIHNGEVNNLRNDIVNYEKQLDEGLKMASNAGNFSSFKPIETNKELLFKLKKYDNNSLLASVFQYKQNLQAVVHRNHNLKYYDTAKNVNPQSRYTFYGEMINEYYFLDSSLQVVKSRNNESSVAKHQDFMNEYYKGFKGMEAYVNLEKKNISSGFGNYVLTLRNAIIEDIMADSIDATNVLNYNRKKIPLSVTRQIYFDSLQNNILVTNRLLENADDSKYATGVYKNGKSINNVIAYVTRVTPENRVGWMKEFNIEIDSAGADANNLIVAMQPTQAGCAMIVRSEHTSNESILNTFIYLDEEGNEILVKRLDINTFPRTINYNEKTNSFIISFRDNSIMQNFKDDGATTLLNINVLGDQLWKYEYNFSGTLENVVNTNNGYILVGNYTTKKDENGILHKTKVNENQTNIYLDFINSTGVLKNTQLIKSDKSMYVANITKVNDSNISLLGVKGVLDFNKRNNRISYDTDLAYIFTNAKLQLLYTNF